MDDRTSPQQFGFDFAKDGVPQKLESDLWRIAHGLFRAGHKITAADFAFLARAVVQRSKFRRYEKGDVSTWLQNYAEAKGLLQQFFPETIQSIQDAIAAAFENVDWDDDESSDVQRPPEFSDDALASAFALQHEHDMRHVAAWGRWLIYDGMCWHFDETLHAFDLSRNICREAAITCINKCSVKTALASAKTVYSVERLAKADRQLAATVDQWDSDPMLLNTPGGVIDLRSGASRMARPGDYMTKITSVAPGADCPIWERFLDRIKCSWPSGRQMGLRRRCRVHLEQCFWPTGGQCRRPGGVQSGRHRLCDEGRGPVVDV